MSNQYVLRRIKETPRGNITQFLAEDGRWYVATNSALTFDTMLAAKLWFQGVRRPDKNEKLFVQGPRGGLYAIR